MSPVPGKPMPGSFSASTMTNTDRTPPRSSADQYFVDAQQRPTEQPMRPTRPAPPAPPPRDAGRNGLRLPPYWLDDTVQTTFEEKPAMPPRTGGFFGRAVVAAAKALAKVASELASLPGTAMLGVARTVIVVVGKTSAGKSSLVEAITGSKVPSGTGIVTRAAMRFCTSPSEKDAPWSARVSVNRLYDVPLPLHIATIYDPRLVADFVLRAQLALLNPTFAIEDFARISRTQLATLMKPSECHDLPGFITKKFTHGYILVEITGPHLPVLEIVDLPGFVGKDKPEHEDIEVLVGGYMSDPNALIVACVDSADDIHNQDVLEKIAKIPGAPLRTMAVNTKFDLLRTDEEQQNLFATRQATHPVGHGWHAISRCASVAPDRASQEDLVNPFERVDIAETQFFEAGALWRNGGAEMRAKLGTASVTKALGKHYQAGNQRLLDEVAAKLAQAREDIDKEQRSLPQESEHPLEDLKQKIEDFRHELYRSFKPEAREGPGYNPVKGAVLPRVFLQTKTIDILESLRTSLLATTPALELCPGNVLDVSWAFGAGAIVTTVGVSRQRSPYTFDAERLRSIFKELRTRQQKGEVAERGTADLLAMFCKPAEPVQDALLSKLKVVVVDHILGSAASAFDGYDRLHADVQHFLLSRVNRIVKRCEKQGLRLIRTSQRPIHYNVDLFDWLFQSLHEALLGALGQASDAEQILNPNQLAQIAKAMAHWKMSMMQVIEGLPTLFDHEIIDTFGEDLSKDMRQALGLSVRTTSGDNVGKTPDELAREYLTESPAIAQRRDHLRVCERQLRDVAARLAQAKRDAQQAFDA